MTPRRLAPLLVLVLALLAACSSVGESSAATVNGSEISADSVQRELKIIRGNVQYRQAVEQQYRVQLAGTGTGTFSSAFTAQVLSLRIYYRLFEQRMRELGIALTPAEERASLSGVREQLKGLRGKRFPDVYVRQLAHQDALVAKLQNEALGGRIGKDYLAAHADEFAQACAAHILVSTDGRTDAEARRIAEDLERQLAAGADFAALARASSDDPGSKEAGGDLGCNTGERFVAEFRRALFSQPIGRVGSPVKTKFGYELILVRSRTAATLETAGEQLGQRAFDAFLLKVTCGKATDVSVNPRFGRWDRSPCKGNQGLAKVSPPTPPTTVTTS